MKTYRQRFGGVLVLLFAGILFGGKPVFNVREYGAAGDGKTLDHSAMNRAIEACVSAGGGTVFVPPGTYLCGSIRLKSNLTLWIEKGATILGAGNRQNVYDLPEELPFEAYQDFGHSHFQNSLMWGVGLNDIMITGGGRIDGGRMTAGIPVPGGGNKSIALKNCRSVTISDITIYRGGHFAILLTGCDNVVLNQLLIDTQRDGINVDCCRNVHISNCTVNSDDDGICLKSSYALGNARMTENVTIANCVVSGYKEGSVISGKYLDEGSHRAKGQAIKRIGRIKFGTESNGGFRNITITNCVFDTCWGLALMSVDGGILENVTISNITMTNVFDAPLFIRLGNRARGPEGTAVGAVRNIVISNVVAVTRYAQFGSTITGLKEHPVENITLRDITIISPGGGTVEDAAVEVPDNERGGPEPSMFGHMPSFGLFARYVKGLTLDNVRWIAKEKDSRAAMIFDGVEDLSLRYVKCTNPAKAPTAIFKNTISPEIVGCAWKE